jgi:hypothetical protein
MADSIFTILLTREFVTVTPAHLPLLKEIQTVLNDSYTNTYCAHPEYFGTSHVRVADPAQLADIIDESGFTLVLVRRSNSGCEVLATGSIKDFGDGDIESYAKWSKNRGGKEWAMKNASGQSTQDTAEKAQAGERKVLKFEVTAFGVAPNAQAGGLGARLLKEMEWLVSNDGQSKLHYALSKDLARVEGLEIHDSSTGSSSALEGIDVSKLKSLELEDVENQSTDEPKLVLICVKELGNEVYYQRRGFKTAWTGTVPIGMWDCKKECTMVYMERDI